MFSWRWKNTQLDKVDVKKINKNLGTYAVLLAALGAMTFFGVCDPSQRVFQGGAGLSSNAAADVAGDKVTNLEFRRAYQNAYNRMQEQYREAFDPAKLRLAEMVLKQLVDERILYRLAVEAGLVVGDEEVMQVLVRAKMFANEKGAFNEEAFNNYLRQNEYTEASFMEEVRRNLTAQKYRQFVQEMSVVSANAAEVDYRLNESKLDVEYLKFDAAVSAVAISDEDATKFAAAKDGQVKIKEYFDRHQNEFKQAPKVHARHILVSFDGARAATEAAKKRTKDEAKKRADEVFAKAKLAGADFNGLAAEYTDEASGKTRGGDLGFFTREAMVKEFSDKAFAMKVGEVSPPVETPFGWHVIKVEAIQEAKNTTLAEATTSIARKLLETEKRASALDGQVKAILASLQKGEDVAATLSTMNVSWTATGGFSPGSGYVPGVGSDKALLSAIGGMSTSKPLAPEVVTVGGTKYILRLKSRTDADMAKFAGSERDRAHKTVEYAQAYGTLQAVEKRLRDDLEKRNRIWLNPEFLAIDDRRAKGQVNAADGGTDEI